MEAKAKELAEMVKVWWKVHKYDTTGEYGERNVYNVLHGEQPDFVTKAKEILGDWESVSNDGIGIKLGDFFTHDASKNTFVCCAMTKRDTGFSIELKPYRDI